MNLLLILCVGFLFSIQCVLLPMPKLTDLREIFGGGPIELFEVANGSDMDFLTSQCIALLITVEYCDLA